MTLERPWFIEYNSYPQMNPVGAFSHPLLWIKEPMTSIITLTAMTPAKTLTG
jgi:hypothetical protein